MSAPRFDAHCHLQDPAFAGLVPGLLADERAAGVAAVVVNGTEPADWPAVERLAAREPLVRPAYGLHPWRVRRAAPGWQHELRRLLASDPGASIGEAGLDHAIRGADLELQSAALRLQLALAVELDRPISLHCVRAWGALAEILRARPLPPRGVVLHAFGGSPELVDELSALPQVCFSFAAGFAGSAGRAAAFRRVPAGRVLVETDAPSLPPRSPAVGRVLEHDGRSLNHPANIGLGYESLAALREQPGEELAAEVAATFRRVFG